MDRHRLQPRKVSYMDLPYDIRHMIYEEVFGETIAVHTMRSKPSNVAPKLLCLNKQIHDEAKEFMLQRNLLFTATSGFFVLDHFLHFLGSPALLQQLRHLTVHVPFLPSNQIGGFSVQFPDTEAKLKDLHAAIAESGLSDPDHVAAHSSEQVLTTHANTFKHAVQQLAGCPGLRRLDLILPQHVAVKDGAPYQACQMWTSYFSAVVQFTLLDQSFPDDAYWAALDGLRRALPALQISLVVVSDTLEHDAWVRPVHPHAPSLADRLRKHAWVLRRARRLGWRVGYTEKDVDGAGDLGYEFGGEALQAVLGGL
ncbi:uncharacterized protein C7974DRAFT_190978 [Neofusicoccum parvum]|uniref:Uncharacterized protein C7974DRAFT_190978 n=1 Tax=Neofusicoccum parvum TaxID=310453 RepID=A0ACB5RS03_9PEZI|nr:uncharacterized protein C7974DRAFT_190978 [Neofusicoccum parvum]